MENTRQRMQPYYRILSILIIIAAVYILWQYVIHKHTNSIKDLILMAKTQWGIWILIVYLSTVGGLMLSYFIGKNLPENWIVKILKLVGISHCREDRSIWLEEMHKRPKLGRSLIKHRVGSLLLRYRYLLLAGLFNLPGNSIIGGGGGISILAGASRVYRVKWFFLTVMLATIPIPLLSSHKLHSTGG